MNILKALEYAKKELLHSKFDSNIRVGLEAELLLSFVLDSTREWLHAWSDREIKKNEFDKFMECVYRRTQGEPIEYIIQKVSFCSESFYVDKRVLIPRPETEILVQKAQALIEAEEIFEVGEIGVGSGIISIMLGLLCPKISIIATDISPLAIEVAQINLNAFATSSNRLKERITLMHTDLFEGVKSLPKLLISNPPYIAKNYLLSENVLYEPHTALFGGKNGDEVLQAIIEFGGQKGIKFLACEIGYDQKECMETYLLDQGYQGVFYKDLSGFYRGFIAYLQ
ncbi:hypothetical protein BKH41_05635 [Helicobacter sp. 12S02232-10]|uniref:N5-glutamine methyltransferase family protein n=1 Tax=Helicobacter sp. 12S02232-10 TaxID=1476197 RepID=UPI000BA60A18|nr:HemK/PrmC family methyltransferase [Helicobacter sp. 12S02232-10]PAF48744.1 hypothetical protein BKH41_05635 [Helicobacter sp. 12S02232-10]